MLVRWIMAVLIGLLTGLWTAERAGKPALFPPTESQSTIMVHLLDNGFHTDLAVPRAALSVGGDALARAVDALPPGDWVRLGWGDAVFYVEQGPIGARMPDGARAFFKPGGNPSVLMLDSDATDPAQTPESGRASVPMSVTGFASLRARVASSLRLDEGGSAVVAARRANDSAIFYASRETFWIGHLCNHWTAEVLNAGGMPMPMVRSMSSGAVMGAARAAAGPNVEPHADELDFAGADD